MLTQHTHENLPERINEGGLHPVEESLHPIEHKDQGKEAWVHHYAVTDSYTPKDSPSKRIGGLDPWLFWLILATISLVVVGASVGGAIGGSLSREGQQQCSITIIWAEVRTQWMRFCIVDTNHKQLNNGYKSFQHVDTNRL
jgi:hypothetical protein